MQLLLKKIPLRMVIKTKTKIILSFVLILFSSCTKLKESETGKMTKSYFSVSEENLPNFLDSSYILIYRIGSIEWSPYSTVLAIKLDNKTHKSNVAFLFQFNFSIEEKKSFIYKTNYMKSYKINLKNVNIKDVERFKLNINDSLLKTYNFNGEGKCSNIYVIRKIGKSDCFILDKNSNERDKQWIKEIFRQISPQEHFQSFSLEKNCNQLDSLAYVLLKTGYIDAKYSYQIDYNEVKPTPKR